MVSTRPRFGAFSYEFGTDRIDDLIEQFSAMGLTGVQWGSDLLNASLAEPRGIPATVAKLNHAKIEVVGIAGYRNLVDPDPDRRQAGIDYLKRCIEVSPQLGTNVVATETGTRNPADWQPHPDNLTADLLPDAERVSQEFCTRYADRFAIAHLKDVSALGAEIDTPAFGDGVFPVAHLKAFLRDQRPDLVIVLEHIDVERIPAAIARFSALEA